MSAPLVVVGIGAEGWPGLGESARAALLGADTVIGSGRQLALLPPTIASMRPWPSPLEPLIDELVAECLAGSGGAVCILASGDPMLHGIGATLARRLPPGRLVVHPQPSAWALACARLGWPAAEVELVSAVAQPPEVVARLLQPGRRLVIYLSGSGGAAAVASLLCEHGFGPSRFVVLEQLGGPAERTRDGSAAEWGEAPADPLHCLAIECTADADTTPRALTPGLPDGAYESDGQLTKRHVRAATLAALSPMPGAQLWDVGAGSGSIAIEWLRAEPTAKAIAIEEREERARRIEINALRLGVPALRVICDRAPQALEGLPTPDAVFLGGGLNTPGLIESCWGALAPGGRIVSNAVTLEGEQTLIAARATRGGELVRIAISHAEPLGSFEVWRAQLPVIQWSARKEPA